MYHCFDRIVIQGYLPLLTRPEHIVHFFRDVHGQYPITPQVLSQRTLQYRAWVESYAHNHKIPIMDELSVVILDRLRAPSNGKHGASRCPFNSDHNSISREAIGPSGLLT